MSSSTTPRRSPIASQEERFVIGAWVGPWKISDIGKGRIYVGHESGEGGTFKVEQLTPYLEAFWREHF